MCSHEFRSPHIDQQERERMRSVSGTSGDFDAHSSSPASPLAPGISEQAELQKANSTPSAELSAVPLEFHPAAPTGVHCPPSGVGKFSVTLRWNPSNPELLWRHRDCIHYLVYSQPIYDASHPKATLLDHFELVAVVDCAGRTVTNGGRKRVEAARSYVNFVGVTTRRFPCTRQTMPTSTSPFCP